jgi:hypothetical protein
VTCVTTARVTCGTNIDDVATPQGATWVDRTLIGQMSWQLTGQGTVQLDQSHIDKWQGSANERPPHGDLPLAYIG